MIIVYGTRCYGRADVIEGLGHVTCRFVHIMFVPLIPIETLFLVDEDRGMKLPFSFKAALSGWMRAGAILSGLGLLFLSIGAFSDDEPLAGAFCVLLGLVSFAAFPLWGMLFGKCSPQRKMELMSMMGLSAADLGHAQAPAPAYPQQPQAYPQQHQHPAYAQQPQPHAYPQPGGYGAPGYGPPQQHAPQHQPQPGGYGAPPPPAGGFGAPQPYGAPQPQGYGGPQPQGYGGPQPQGYGGPAPGGYGPPGGWDPNRR